MVGSWWIEPKEKPIIRNLNSFEYCEKKNSFFEIETLYFSLAKADVVISTSLLSQSLHSIKKKIGWLFCASLQKLTQSPRCQNEISRRVLFGVSVFLRESNMKGTKILLFLVVLSCSSFSFSSSSSSPSSSPGLLVEKRRCADQQCLGTVEDTKNRVILSSCSFNPTSPSVNVISRRIFLPKYFVTQIVKSNFVKRQTGQKKPRLYSNHKELCINMLWLEGEISVKCLICFGLYH